MPRSLRSIRFLLATAAGLVLAAGLTGPLAAQETGAAPAYGEFPAADGGKRWMGELIDVDPINRRGLIRPGGDLAPDRYNRFLGQPFAMLPYGMIYYHGAPAELKDIPLGTVLHGVLYQPPPGDDSVPRPDPQDKVDAQRAKYFVEHTHALLLEDDVSFYRRRGQAWKVTGIETSEMDGRQFLVVTSVGKEAPGGLHGEQKFCIDKSTRVWQGKEFAGLGEIQAGQAVHVNLTWDPGWGYGKFHVSDVWLDQQAQDVAAEVQRQTHLRYQRYHWPAGWVDRVTYDPSRPNGAGSVYVTLSGGLDPSLDEEIIDAKRAEIAIAEPTLRTWRKDHDAQGGQILEVKRVPDPPLGSSGIQLRVEVPKVPEGFRDGGIVRVGTTSFPAGILPPEERVNGLEDRSRSLSGSVAPSQE
ncbi:MAG TPA: hypothetical protein VFV87_12420 [Pirellulaceae bacterium]|nr:hypothetical protein [Pirellulaceae bacterium]